MWKSVSSLRREVSRTRRANKKGKIRLVASTYWMVEDLDVDSGIDPMGHWRWVQKHGCRGSCRGPKSWYLCRRVSLVHWFFGALLWRPCPMLGRREVSSQQHLLRRPGCLIQESPARNGLLVGESRGCEECQGDTQSSLTRASGEFRQC